MLFVGCLSWSHPLQSGAFIGRAERNFDVELLVFGVALAKIYAEWAPIRLDAVAQFPLRGSAINGDIFDI